MRNFGGSIGHLKNTPPQQVPGFDSDLINPSSEEMAIDSEEGDNDDDPSGTNEHIIINSGELNMSKGEEDNEDEEGDENDDDNNNDSDEGGDQMDEDEDDESGCSGDEEEEGEDDYGYASP